MWMSSEMETCRFRNGNMPLQKWKHAASEMETWTCLQIWNRFCNMPFWDEDIYFLGTKTPVLRHAVLGRGHLRPVLGTAHLRAASVAERHVAPEQPA